MKRSLSFGLGAVGAFALSAFVAISPITFNDEFFERIDGVVRLGPIFGMYYAKNYGSCTWNSTNDVGSCINTAIAAAKAAGGGKVVLPSGNFGLSTKISETSSPGIMLEGAGCPGNFGVCPTTLTWIGATNGTMYERAPTSNNIVGGGCRGIGFKGGATSVGAGADIAIKLRANSLAVFESCRVDDVQAIAWDIDAGDWANGGMSMNKFLWNNIGLTGAGAVNAKGYKLGQSATSTLNDSWGNIWIGGIIQRQAGVAFECGAADSNEIYGLDVQSGTGASLHLLGHNLNLNCRSNRFITTGGWGRDAASRPIADTGTFPSQKNYIYQNGESGALGPTINGDATVWCHNNRGANCGNLGVENLTEIKPTNPTGAPTGGTRTMMGLTGSGLCSGTCSFTPRSSGVIEVTIIGAIQGSASTTTSNSTIHVGTGIAPLNGAGVPGGSTQSAQVVDFDAGVAAKRYPISIKARFSGLTVDTAYWIDMGISSFNGTTTPAELVIHVREIP